MRSEQPAVALIGAGHMGALQAAALQARVEQGACRPAGVADINAGRGRAVAERLECRAYSDASELLEHEVPDLVIVATPPSQHAEDVRRCLAMGAYVLCEKPLAVDMDGLAEMVCAGGAGRLAVASKFRFDEDVRTALKLVSAGAIGDMMGLDVCFARQASMREKWHLHPGLSGGGVLMDNGPHALDLTRLFLGALSEISVTEGVRRGDAAVETSVIVELRSVQGVSARALLSWDADLPERPYLLVRGSLGCMELGFMSARLVTDGADEPMTFGEGFNNRKALLSQLDDLLDAVLLGREPTGSFPGACASVHAIVAGYASMAAGKWMALQASSQWGAHESVLSSRRDSAVIGFSHIQCE